MISKNTRKTLKTQGKTLKFKEETQFFRIFRILWWCEKDVQKRPWMLLYTFIPFHTLWKALQAFISFPTLSYTLFYAFICFHMLFIHFHTLSYAFYMLSYTFKRKEAKRPLPSLNVPRTQGIVRLSRCAAGKNGGQIVKDRIRSNLITNTVLPKLLATNVYRNHCKCCPPFWSDCNLLLLNTLLHTRSLVYKGMVYKGFFGPVLDFQKKLGFWVLDLGDLRVLENMSVLRPKQTHSIFLYIWGKWTLK